MLEQAQVDISGMNFQQLEQLLNRVEHRVTEMRETGAPALREQWGEQAAAIGMTIEEILQAGERRGRGNQVREPDASGRPPARRDTSWLKKRLHGLPSAVASKCLNLDN